MFKFILALLSMFVLTTSINAQVTDQKFEVGGFFTSITLNDFKDRVLPGFATGDATVNGIGGRLTYNINENFAIDGEGSFFPSNHFNNDEIGQKTQAFVGVKTPLGRICGVDHETDFALDLGGVVEFYPAERAIIRVDAGNTLVRYQDRPRGTFGSTSTVDGGFKSNFQVSLGFGWRF